MQHLTEAGDEVQPLLDMGSGGLDSEAAIRVEQLLAIEDGQRTYVLGPSFFLGPDQHEVCGRQAFNP